MVSQLGRRTSWPHKKVWEGLCHHLLCCSILSRDIRELQGRRKRESRKHWNDGEKKGLGSSLSYQQKCYLLSEIIDPIGSTGHEALGGSEEIRQWSSSVKLVGKKKVCPFVLMSSSGEEKVLPPLFSLSLELSTCQLQTNPPWHL